MKTLWNRLTLECHRQPGDTEKMPWYAVPAALLFIAGWLAVQIILSDSGF